MEKLTLFPKQLGASDVHAAYEHAIEQVDLEHAVLVCSAFTIINRMVDAFGADVTEEQAETAGNLLNLSGKVMVRQAKGQKDPPFGDEMPAFAIAMAQSVRKGEGDAPRGIREAIEARTASTTGASRPDLPLPAEVRDFVDKVNLDVFGLQERHFTDLQQVGWSEEAIYEFVFAACAGAALGRIEVAWEAIANAG